MVVVAISKERLLKMYRSEFTEVKQRSVFPNEPIFLPTGSLISLQDWYDERMNKRKAIEIFSNAFVDEIIEIETNQ